MTPLSNSKLFNTEISVSTVERLIQYQSSGISETIARKQSEGTTAIYNILTQEHIAYLADEVGMGKTYQALGLIGLAWAIKPDAKILVIAPRAAVQQKWQSEYENFISHNITAEHNWLKDSLLKTPVHPTYYCQNLIDLINGTLHEPHSLFITRLSSFSSLARSVGVNVKEPISDAELVSKLYQHGIYITQKRDQQGKIYNESMEMNIALAEYLSHLLPRYDLVVIDEAQNLRNRGDNIRTRVLSKLLRLAISGTPAESDLDAMPHVLMMSATPAHRSEEDLFTQLSYVSPEAQQAKHTDKSTHKSFFSRFLVRRLRLFEKPSNGSENGKALSKYDYRTEKKFTRKVDDNPVEELFLALVQKKLAEELHQKGQLNTRLKIGFLETFESYEPSEYYDQSSEDDSEESESATHTDTDEKSAPDRQILMKLAKDYEHAVGRSKLPPHPKQVVVEEEVRKIFAHDDPEKLLIFVRRIASVKELVRRAYHVFDTLKLEEMTSLIGHDNIKSRLTNYDTFEDVGQFGMYVNDILGHSKVEEGATDAPSEEATEDEASDENSLVLALFASRRDEGAESSNRFRTRFNPDQPLSRIFEENIIRFLYSQIEHDTYHNYKSFVKSIYTGEVRNTILNVLYLDHHSSEIAQPKYYMSKRRTKLRHSRIRALLIHLLLEKLSKLYPDKKVIGDLLRIWKQRYPDYYTPLQEELTIQPEPAHEQIVHSILDEYSFWDYVRERGNPEWECAQFLQYGSSLALESADREILKSLISKNLRMSDGILYLFVAFDRVGGNKTQEISKKLFQMMDQNEIPKMIHRINRFIQLYPHIRKLLEGSSRVIKPLYLESSWNEFNNQKPALSVMGSTSARQNAIIQFNSTFFPDILIATDVFKEGVDLHLSCDRVWHYGLGATPGDIEQRSGRIDRYFSKVHREIMAGHTSDGILEIGYPYLEKSIDEQQVARALQRKLDVQPLMDTGLSHQISDDLSMETLETLSVEDILNALNDMGEQSDIEPFPVSNHLQNGQNLSIQRNIDRILPEQFETWVTNLIQSLVEFGIIATDTEILYSSEWNKRHDVLSDLLFIANVRLTRKQNRSILLKLTDSFTSEDQYREQPILFRLKYNAHVKMHFLRIITPLGDHNPDTTNLVERLLHHHYPYSGLKCILIDDEFTSSRWWKLSMCYDIPIRASLPEYKDILKTVERVCEISDDIEYQAITSGEEHQDIKYDQVKGSQWK